MFTVWPIANTILAVYVGISELFLLNLQFSLLDIFAIRDIPFFYEEGRSEDFMGGGGGGGHIFFSEPKKGDHVFFQNLILNIFLRKVCNIRNQSASCTTEPLFVSLSNMDLQRFCLIHELHGSILKDLFIN